MLEVAHLLAVVDEYRRVTGVSDTTVSHRVFKDSKKIAALRGKSDLYTKRFNDALVWFSENWPEGAVWPSDIVRPQTEAAA